MSIKELRTAAAEKIRRAATAVDNAKTPSLKEIRHTVSKGIKKARHAVATTIDCDVEEK